MHPILLPVHEPAPTCRHTHAFALIAAPALRAADLTWTTHANIQYGELQRGNRDASTNLVSLDVYVPDGLAPEERLPLVIMIHGGAWTEGDKAHARVVEQKIPSSFPTATFLPARTTNYLRP